MKQKLLALVACLCACFALTGCDTQDTTVNVTVPEKSNGYEATVFVSQDIFDEYFLEFFQNATDDDTLTCENFKDSKKVKQAFSSDVTLEPASKGSVEGCLITVHSQDAKRGGEQTQELLPLIGKDKNTLTHINFPSTGAGHNLFGVEEEYIIVDKPSKYTVTLNLTLPKGYGVDTSIIPIAKRDDRGVYQLHVIYPHIRAVVTQKDIDSIYPQSYLVKNIPVVSVVAGSAQFAQRLEGNAYPNYHPTPISPKTEVASLLTGFNGLIAIVALSLIAAGGLFAKYYTKRSQDRQREQESKSFPYYEESEETDVIDYDPVLVDKRKNNGWGFLDGEIDRPKDIMSNIDLNSFGGAW